MIPVRPFRIAVCCSGTPDDENDRLAEEVGMAIGRAKAILICGGLFGGMEAAARGAVSAGGITIGFLPGVNTDDANDYIVVPLATGLGEARNFVLVRSADAVIGIGGEWGTLSELALAKKIGKPIVLLRPALAANWGLPVAQTPEQAVQMALSFAQP
ncbi:MAG: TIGR00725 family protein [Gemmatimonadota bacterium]